MKKKRHFSKKTIVRVSESGRDALLLIYRENITRGRSKIKSAEIE